MRYMEQAKCYVIDIREISKGMAEKITSRSTVVRSAGLAFVLLTGIETSAFAAGNTGIDAGANELYKKIVNVGKWVIIVKGGMDTIKHVAEGDFQSAKKGFLGYLLTYALLWALPWGMDEIEKLFDQMSSKAASS